MKIRHPFLIRLSAFVAAWIIRLWTGTFRLRKLVIDGTPHPVDPKSRRFIFAIWHDSVFSLSTINMRADVLVSQHADGEMIAQVCGFLNLGVVRGSATRGGVGALLKFNASKRWRHIVITPDGPRGPRHCLKQGIVALASQTGLPIVLVGIGFARPWRLSSWDRTQLPRPWSVIHAIASEPIEVPRRASREELELYRSRIERRFLHLSKLAEQWAESGRRPTPLELTLETESDLEFRESA